MVGNDLLITKVCGARVRPVEIFTNMPVQHDDPDHESVERVRKACAKCGRCSEACPAWAISKVESPECAGNSLSSNSEWPRHYIDSDRCFSQWYRSGLNCSSCISVYLFSDRVCSRQRANGA